MTTASFRHSQVAVRGLQLFVRELGEGPPILFLSGLGFGGWCWTELMSAMGPQWRMVAPDNRGTGRSDKPPGPYSIGELAEDAARLIEVLQLAPVHLVATSMGGYIALTLAARHPALVRSLVLVNTSKGGLGTLPVPVSTREIWREFSHLSAREFAEKTMALAYTRNWPDENAERFRHYLECRLEFPTPPECRAAHYEAAEEFIYKGVDVSGIRKPALVVYGTDDRIVPYQNGIKLSVALPQAQVVSLSGKGHLPFLEDPEGMADLIEEFLSRAALPLRGAA